MPLCRILINIQIKLFFVVSITRLRFMNLNKLASWLFNNFKWNCKTQFFLTQSRRYCTKVHIPASTRRCFDVVTTLLTSKQRWINVRTTSCAYWEYPFKVMWKKVRKHKTRERLGSTRVKIMWVVTDTGIWKRFDSHRG